MNPREFFMGAGAKDFYNNTASNIVGQGLNMAFSNYYAQKQLQYQKELNQDSFDKQVEFWNKQNKYNTPAAQMSRYIDAGLNPALMNQGTINNQAGGLSSVASGQANVPVPNQSINPVDSILTRAGQLKQMGLVDKQTEEYVQRIAGIILDNDIKEISKAMGWSEARLEELKRTAHWEATFGNLDKFVDNPYLDGNTSQLGDMLINVYKTDEDVRRAEESRIKAETNYTNSLASTEDALRDARIAYQNATTAEARQNIAHSVAQQSLVPLIANKIERETDLILSQDLKTDQERYKLEQEVLRLMDTREFNKLIQAAGVTEAEANAIVSDLKAKQHSMLAENVSGGTNILDYLANLADSIIFNTFAKN